MNGNREIRIVVPFKLDSAKSRLSPVLSPDERRLLAFAMLRDVLRIVSNFGRAVVLSRPGLADLAGLSGPGKAGLFDGSDGFGGFDGLGGIEIIESELDLNDAINELIEAEALSGWRRDILIVMADLSLIGREDLARILSCSGDVVLTPGRGGGTNMILIRSPRFRTCYLGLSYPKHLRAAAIAGLDATVYESFRAGMDIDEPEDLAELLLHGRGTARSLLERLGFRLSDKGRAAFTRDCKGRSQPDSSGLEGLDRR